MIKHTITEVMETIREVVAERGEDFVYEGPSTAQCVYAHNGEASCLVGKVIAKLEPEIFEEVVRIESAEGRSWSVYEFGGTVLSTKDYVSEIEIPELSLSRESIRLLAHAQTTQDQHHAYGVVLETTENEFARLAARPEVEYDEYRDNFVDN